MGNIEKELQMNNEGIIRQVVFILINHVGEFLDHPIVIGDDNSIWYKMRCGDSDATGEPYYVSHQIEPQHALDILNAALSRKSEK